MEMLKQENILSMITSTVLYVRLGRLKELRSDEII